MPAKASEYVEHHPLQSKSAPSKPGRSPDHPTSASNFHLPNTGKTESQAHLMSALHQKADSKGAYRRTNSGNSRIRRFHTREPALLEPRALQAAVDRRNRDRRASVAGSGREKAGAPW